MIRGKKIYPEPTPVMNPVYLISISNTNLLKNLETEKPQGPSLKRKTKRDSLIQLWIILQRDQWMWAECRKSLWLNSILFLWGSNNKSIFSDCSSNFHINPQLASDLVLTVRGARGCVDWSPWAFCGFVLLIGSESALNWNSCCTSCSVFSVEFIWSI